MVFLHSYAGLMEVGDPICPECDTLMKLVKLPQCPDCNDNGWDIYDVDNTGYLEVERCDSCKRFETDDEAEAAVPPGVIARIKHFNGDRKRPSVSDGRMV